MVCLAGSVTCPFNEEELISIVANATKSKTKMKVATRFSHSIPKLVCPSGEDGLIICTKNLNHVVEIDAEAKTITLESSVTLRQLISEAAKAGLALPYAPYWWGLTIGGILGTGAHGSTLWSKGSSVHDYVVGLTIVSPGGFEYGYVKVRKLNDSDQDLNAAKVSLGVLGVISQVTLKLQSMFKQSITYLSKNDSDCGDQVLVFGKQHEFADMIWYPSQHKVVYRMDDRVSSDMDAYGKCLTANLFTSLLINNGLSFTGYPVIGYQHRLQSSGTCQDSLDTNTSCGWDPKIKGQFFYQTSFSISLSMAKNFIQDVQNPVEIEPKALCGVETYNGILMRYVTASSAYLGKQENAINFNIRYYRSKDPMTPRLYEGILKEVEQIAMFKYGALPHWGKNRNVAFDGFLRVKDVYDPMGLFSSEWTDQVFGLKRGVSVVKEGCALEGLCICSQDIHCAPRKGYFCRPGKVFEDARVCTLVN
ncbi:unnamed protein product [Malus baccata var. baccata]